MRCDFVKLRQWLFCCFFFDAFPVCFVLFSRALIRAAWVSRPVVEKGSLSGRGPKCRYSPILPLAAGCVHYGDKQDVGRRLSLGVRAAVYNDPTVREANGPYLASVAASPANGTLTLAFDQPIEVRNASGFEVSTNGEAYVAAGIVTRGADTVTLTTAGLGHGAAVASLRYILHDTPCINQTCAIYASATGLPSGPLVANLPGHAGADSVGWNMTG